MSDAEAQQSSFSAILDRGVSVAAVVGAIGGMLGLVYGIGGAVMWLRFHHQGLPADQAVALVPKADLLVIGMRVMVLPALASGLVLLALASVRHARSVEFDRLVEERVRVADDDRLAEIDARLERLRQRPRPLDALPRPLRRPAQVLLALLVVCTALVVPFSVGAFVWPLVFVGLTAYWLRLRREAPIGSGRHFPIWRIAIAGIVGAAVISVARQTDPPVQLPSVQLVITGVPELRSTLVLDPGSARRTEALAVKLTGVLVSATDRHVAIGDPVRGTIVSVARSHVSSMIVGPALDLRAPPSSLLSRFLGRDVEWAVTPLEIWCENERYSWIRLADACEGRARIPPGRLELKVGGALTGLRVRCPAEASRGTCRGFFTMQTAEAQQSRQAARALVAETAPAEYAVTRRDSAGIRLAIHRDFVGAHWTCPRDRRPKSRSQSKSERPTKPFSVPVRLRLSLDARGDAVVFDERRDLKVNWCVTKPDGAAERDGKPRPEVTATPTTTATPTPAPGQPEQTTTPTPEAPTATPTAEPDLVPPPPPEDTLPIPTTTPSGGG